MTSNSTRIAELWQLLTLQANGFVSGSGSDLSSLDSGMAQPTPLNVKAGALSEKLSKRFDSLGKIASPDSIKKRGLRVCTSSVLLNPFMS